MDQRSVVDREPSRRSGNELAAAAVPGLPAGAGVQPAVELRGVTKEFGEVRAVDDVSLSFQAGEFVALVGPSGCGKTTLLRMVAGLETPTHGDIVLHGQDVFSAARRVNLLPHRRHLGMVFQSYALWPHMTAFDNVAYPLRRSLGRLARLQRGRASQIRERVEDALRQVHCAELSSRYPSEMSGGQQQRIALARAIVDSPRIVLMDEPLSNLDAKLRTRLRFELRAIQQELGFTAVYVTHDRAEAVSMADTVVVLNAGRVEQAGPPVSVYEHPTSAYVSDFLGDHNLLSAVVEAVDAEVVTVATSIGSIPLDGQSGHALAVGDRVRLALPQDSARLETWVEASRPRECVEVIGVAYCGWYSEVLVRSREGEEITLRTLGQAQVSPGSTAHVTVDGPVTIVSAGSERPDEMAQVEG
ncbi:MAG: ABC transporter ATP-binding protein [Ilumatobacteraceae bacterium]